MTNTCPTDHVSTIYRFCAQSMHYPDPLWLTKQYFSSLYDLLDALGGEKEKELLTSTLNSSRYPSPEGKRVSISVSGVFDESIE